MKRRTLHGAKRALALLLSVLFACGTLETWAGAAVTDPGAGQDTCYYGLSDDKETLYLAGQETEHCKDTFEVTSDSNLPWLRSGSLTTVIFDDDLYPTSTKSWFYGCQNLKTIQNIEKLHTKYVTDMAYMFSFCQNLTQLDVSGFDTSKVTDMRYMFSNCENLTQLDVSKFVTSQVTDMSYMFYGSFKLTQLDVSRFDMSKVRDMNMMFAYISRLKTVRASRKADWSGKSGAGMFEHCTSLKGGKGTVYDSSHTNSSYARVDGGSNAPGYFTPYSINIADGIQNGTVTVKAGDEEVDAGDPGERITVTLTPEGGYTLQSASATGNGETEPLASAQIQEGTVTFSFDMPNNDVTIDAAFQLRKDKVRYVDEKGVDQGEQECIPVGSKTKNWTDGNWYAVTDSVEISDRVEVTGTVNLILCDGATLTAEKGIELAENNHLIIWNEKKNGSGKLIAGGEGTTPSNSAGIGGHSSVNCGALTVYGGTVTATGGIGSGGDGCAGIGGGQASAGGTVTIYGGTVTAVAAGDNGAGIGSGSVGYESGGAVTIYGGTVTATGKGYGAGIGAGNTSAGRGAVGTVTIYGGTVTAAGGEWGQNWGPAIGGSSVNDCNLTIYDGAKVKAGSDADTAKAVELAKKLTECYEQRYAYIEPCADHSFKNYVCEWCGTQKSVTKVKVPYVDQNGKKQGDKECIQVESGTVSWTDGGWYAVTQDAEIYDRIEVTGTVNLILCDKATLTAQKGIHLKQGNTLIIWSETENGSGKLIAGEETIISFQDAGIGGNENEGGGDVKVNGGDVKAAGGNFGAGIGGGDDADGLSRYAGDVTVNGGTVTAVGGANSAAIGSSDVTNNPKHGDLKIYTGAKVTAGEAEDVAQKASAGERVEKCRESYAKIEPCASHEYENSACKWCGLPKIVKVRYVNEKGEDQGEKECIQVGSGTTSWTDGNWYAVTEKDTTITDRIEVTGTVNLILCDGATLTAEKGIDLWVQNHLIIWNETADGSGALIAGGEKTTPDGCAGIGGIADVPGGKLTVYGGNVTAYSGNDGAGIGGGSGKGTAGRAVGGEVNIYGGTVKATARDNDGAGIGGGADSAGGTVNIYGGTVEATGYSAIGNGIGRGGEGTLTIYDTARVIAESGDPVDPAQKENHCQGQNYVKIEPCKDHAYENGACKWCGTEKPMKKVKVHYVNEKDVDQGEKECIQVESHTTKWTDGNWYAVTENATVKGRIEVTGTVNLILCDGATLTAEQGVHLKPGNALVIWKEKKDGSGALIAGGKDSTLDRVAAIGGNNEENGGDLTVYGGNVTAGDSKHGACIGGGYKGNGGTVTVYGGEVTTNGHSGGAGIGGGVFGDGGTVTVYGGRVMATGSIDAAGIGGGIQSKSGRGGNGGEVYIYGGTVEAFCGINARAIGCGEGGSNDGPLTIYDTAKVTAGKNKNENAPVPATERVSASQKNSYAKIEPCEDHSDTYPKESIKAATHTGVCEWCGRKLEEKHSFRDGKCTKCAYEHVHNWQVKAGGNMATVSCSDAGCTNPGPHRATLTAKGGDYTGNAYTATVTTSKSFPADVTVGEITYYDGKTALNAAPVDAGDYTAKVTVGDKTISQNFAIGKEAITPEVTLSGWTYGDNAATPKVTGNLGGGTVTYRYREKDGTAFTDKVPTDAGDYVVEATVPETKNYQKGMDTAEFTIGKRPVKVSGITAKGKTYDGKTNVTLLYDKAVFDNIVQGDALTVSATGAFETADAGENKTVKISGLKLGGASVKNYELAKKDQQTETTATIKPKTVGLKWTDTEFTYDGAQHKPTAEATGLIVNDTCAVTVDGKKTDAGDDYIATASKLDNKNYALPTENTTKFSIKPKAITATADDKSSAYKVELEKLSFTVTGLVDGDSADSIKVDLSCDAKKTSPVGSTFPITGKQAKGSNPNYSVTVKPGTYTITKAGATVTAGGYSDTYDGKPHGIEVTATPADEVTVYYSDKTELTANNFKTDGVTENPQFTDVGTRTVYYYVDSGNYEPKPVAGSQTVAINAAKLTVEANPATVTYGSAPTNDGVKYSGFVNGETEAVLGGKLAYDYSYARYGDVGDYTITPKGLTSDNYSISFEDGTLKVEPLAAELSWTGDSFVYDGKEQSVTATVSNAVNKDPVTVELTDGAKTAAGDYTAKATGLTGEKAKNYTLDTGAKMARHDWSITKAKVTVTAEDKTSIYGDPMKELTWKVTEGKLAQGDSLTVKLTTDAKQGSDVGEYTVSGTCEDANYDVTVKQGTYTITKAKVTVTADNLSKVYGEQDPELTYQADGLVNGDTLGGALSRENGEDVGDYTIGQGDLSASDNYDLSFTEGTLSITPKPLTQDMVTIQPESTVATGSEITPEVTVTDGDKTLTIESDYEITGDTIARTAGTYEVTVTGIGNYTDSVTVSYTLTQPKAGKLETVIGIQKSVPVTKVTGLTKAIAKDLLTEDEAEQMFYGTDAKVSLSVTSAKCKPAESQAVKTAVLGKQKNATYKTVSCFDLTLQKQVGDSSFVACDKTSGEITVTVPSFMPTPAKGISRTGYVTCIRKGKAKIITSGQGKTLQFKTSSFDGEKYVLSYVDVQTEPDVYLLNAGLKVSQTKKQINVKWGYVSKADGYQVFIQYCGQDFPTRPSLTIHSEKTTSATFKTINGKKLNLRKSYKVYVVAIRKKERKTSALGKSISAHVVGRNNKYYSNVKKIKLKKSAFTLNMGKSATIKAKAVLVHPKRRQLSSGHAPQFRYSTTDKTVATVNRKGKITAKGKGACTVYVYARNGYAEKVDVTVK